MTYAPSASNLREPFSLLMLKGCGNDPGDRMAEDFGSLIAVQFLRRWIPRVNHTAARHAGSVSASRLIVERQVKHLTRLIDDLMDISRISQGKLEMRRTATSLNNIIQLAIEITRPQLEARQHPLQINLPLEDLTLYADPNRLARGFANLLHNAAKYSAAGTPIEIQATVGAATVAVNVIDAGNGIPPDMLERIFDPFTQVDRPTGEAREGLDIGLTLVKRIVQLHEGSISAASEGWGRGAQFTVRLPLLQTPESTGHLQGLTSPSPPRQQLQILVTDDNRDAALTLAMVLRLEGHDVRTAHHGAEALTIGDVFRPLLMIIDIGMPVLDGYETAAAIQARSWGVKPCLLALTGWGQEADVRRALVAGFHHHLVKPVEPDSLRALIDKIAQVE